MEVQVGLRVVRGPNWRWGDQDGGEGHVGTVIEVQRAGRRDDSESTKTPCVVTVQWDCGNRCRYRCGIEDKYDLRVIDSAPAGIRHCDVVCDGCAQEGITGIRWKCVKCNDYDLCTVCYLNGKHRFEHEFERMDTPTLRTRVPARHATKRKEIRGIFVHAQVIPGYDWQQPPGEGALGGSGVVVGIQGVKASDNSRSFAEVLWNESQVKTIHRVGHEGKVDLKCVDSASGGYYYPDHLPVLGAPLVSPGPQDISTGDLVRVELEADIFKAMQEGHGGWSDPMLEVLGKIGTVQAILDSGDLRVKYSAGTVWTIGPEAVAKVDVPRFKVGDKVRVLGDVTKVSELQKGHGEWGQHTALFLGEVCSVISVLSNGDLGLVAKGRTWYFNPLCVTPADEDGAALSSTSEWYKQDTDELLQMQRLSLFELDNPSVVFAATMASDISMLRTYLQRHPKHVDAKYGDRAALHQAAGIGNVPLIKLLLEFGATVDIEDDYSNKPLHLSVISGHVEATRCLVDANADVNTKTVEGLTPLMYAAQMGHVAAAKVLLSHPRIQIHDQDIDGNTALHTAVFFRKNRMVYVLLEAGADPTLLNFQLFTSIHYAAWMGFLPAIEHCLDRFPEHSNLKNDYGYTILHLAAFYNHCDIVNLAAEQRGCEIDARSDTNQTPLHIAILRGHSKIVERLVGYGAGVNTLDEDGNNPLYMVLSMDAMEPPSDDTPELKKIHEVLMGDLKSTPDNALPVVTCMTMTVFLLRKGADMHIKNKKGSSALTTLPFLATLMSLIVEAEDLFVGELPPGHIGLFPSEFGGNLQIRVSSHLGRSGSKQGQGYRSSRGYSQRGYGYNDNSSYGLGQSTDYYDDQDSYSYGGGQASTSQRFYSRAGEGSPYGGSGGASGEGRSYTGASNRAATYSQTASSPGYAYGYAGGSSANVGKGRSYSSHAGSYSQTASSSSYAYDYAGEQGYTGAYSSAYDPDDEEPKSKHSRPPASITPKVVPVPYNSQVLTSTYSASVLSTAKPKGEGDLCFLCDNPADIRFSPCGHSAMCHECAPRAKRCPTCRNPVDGFSEMQEFCIKCAQKATVTRPCGHKFCTACDKLPVCFGCSQADLD